MKRIRLVGLGAVAGTVATAVAFFFDPRSGPRRRAAVKRGGENVARQSANVAAMMGSAPQRGQRRGSSSALEEVRSEIEASLVAGLGASGLSLSVIAGEGVITVRGEVDDLAQVATVSRALAPHEQATEIVNLVRVRIDPARGVAAAG